jgi:hypothetical protein
MRTENFDKLIKMEKRKKLLKTIGISFLTTLMLLGIGFMAINKRMSTQSKKVQEIMNIKDMIQSPNITSFSQYFSNSKRMTAQMRSERFKNIAGYPIATTALEMDFDLFGSGGVTNSPLLVPTSETHIGAFNRYNGQKIPLFFNPNVKVAEPNVPITHEAKTLSELKHHVAEVAVSFTEPLTYETIREKIPTNLLINWYWIGTATDKLSTEALLDKVIGLNAVEKGKLSDSNYSSFVVAAKKATEKLVYVTNDIDIYQDALKQIKKYPTLKTAKFSGIIVSGRTEDLAKLDAEPYVYATNVGLETEILPYMMPVK